MLPFWIKGNSALNEKNPICRKTVLLHHDNAQSHICCFLGKKNRVNYDSRICANHSLVALDFHLFPELKLFSADRNFERKRVVIVELEEDVDDLDYDDYKSGIKSH